MNKLQHSHTMVSLYTMAGITKQAHYKRVKYRLKKSQQAEELLAQAQELRKDHPRLGCRKLYYEIKPEGMGRDQSEAVLLANGFRIKRKRNYCRTTYAGKHWYTNHIQGMKVENINQLWVSDITYIPLNYRQHYFLTLVQDVYSRKVVGWSLSEGLRSIQTVVPAYQMAINKLKPTKRRGLIFHSDKGSQYSWHGLDRLHRQYGVIPSMGGKAWENAHAESINGVIKNEYINFTGRDISFKQAQKMMEVVIKKYNDKRPHGSLNYMKPTEFEQYIKTLNKKQKPVFEINY